MNRPTVAVAGIAIAIIVLASGAAQKGVHSLVRLERVTTPVLVRLKQDTTHAMVRLRRHTAPRMVRLAQDTKRGLIRIGRHIASALGRLTPNARHALVWLKGEQDSAREGRAQGVPGAAWITGVASAIGRSGSYAVAALTPTLVAQAASKQAVIETSAGTFVVDLTPDTAPATTAYFISQALAGAYDRTTFHRVVKYGMVQGGDPLTKDPSNRPLYGTGGLNAVKAEARAPKMTRGSVAAVLVPGRPDSAGSQFFVAVVDQPGLDGQYTVFGHVSEGMEVVQKISEIPIDDKGVATERLEIVHVTIRDTPPPTPDPFSTETVQELAGYRAVLDTSAGPITIELFPDRAPTHVRQFLRLAQAGVYDGMAFHRVAPGFVIQTGALSSRTVPLTEKQQKLVHPLQPEFNDTKHVKGIVSMARGEDPASATTSFFICTGVSAALDGQYTAFGRVIEGMSAVDAIEAAPRNGETPLSRIDLKTVRVERR